MVGGIGWAPWKLFWAGSGGRNLGHDDPVLDVWSTVGDIGFCEWRSVAVCFGRCWSVNTWVEVVQDFVAFCFRVDVDAAVI